MAIEHHSCRCARMRHFLGKNPAAAGVRFGVKRTGCSGFGYMVDLATEVTDADKVVELDGIRLMVDAKSLAVGGRHPIDFRGRA